MSDKVKVRMKTTSAGPEGVFMRGQEVPVSTEEAEQLVARGYAEYIEILKRDAENMPENDQNEADNEQEEQPKRRKKE